MTKHRTGSTKRPKRRLPAEGALDRHRFAPLVASLRDEPSFVSRPMFGCVACYVEGRLVLVLADRREPWLGLLVPSSQERHAALLEKLPELRVHSVLRKWLCLPETSACFAETAHDLVRRILGRDPLIGVEAAPPRLPARRRR